MAADLEILTESVTVHCPSLVTAALLVEGIWTISGAEWVSHLPIICSSYTWLCNWGCRDLSSCKAIYGFTFWVMFQRSGVQSLTALTVLSLREVHL